MKQLILLSSFLVCGFATRSLGQSGALDNDFNGGIVATSVSTDDEFARAVAIQSDGKIVVAGNVSFNGAYSDFTLARYNSDGTLDSYFGNDGKLISPVGESDDVATCLVIQPDGKLVVAGYSYVGSHLDFALARFNKNGTPDGDFSLDGKLTTSIGELDDVVNAIAQQPDGKIVVAGYSSDGKKDHFALARYNVDGTLDNSFDSDGMLVLFIGDKNDVATSLSIQANGEIVVAGFSDNGTDNDFAIARINNDGTLDHSFGNGGIVLTPIGAGNDCARSMAIQPDEKIILAGESFNGHSYDFALARYNKDGTLDNGFGTEGKQTTSIGANSGYARSVAVQRDGKILIAGFSSTDRATNQFALARFDAEGNLDYSFSSEGQVITPIGKFDDEINSLAIQKDGKIIAAGSSDNGADYDFALARYSSDLTPEDDLSAEEIQQMNIFPNPATNEIQISVGGLDGNPQLNVFNIYGEKVSSINLKENKSISLDVANFPAGTYQITITTDEAVKVGRFVKQ